MNTVRDVLKAHGIELSNSALVQALCEAVQFREDNGADVGAMSAALDGIGDDALEGQFVATLKHALDEMAVGVAEDDEPGLTEAEVGLLEGGFETSSVDPRALVALELAAMMATAVSVNDMAGRTNWNTAQVQKLIKHGGLLAFPEADGYRIPAFQFGKNGELVPHLGDVLPELIPNVHPVGVLHWFTEPNPDLVCEATAYDAVSPREWLMRGLPSEPVRELARHAINES